jgi:murein DD-endopeptidase MepM/ murein hydrolase activator NlpD
MNKKYFISLPWLCLGFLLGKGTILGQEHPTSIDLLVPFCSATVLIKGKPTTYYELHLTNFSNNPIQIDKLEVLNIDKSEALFSSESEDLKTRFSEQGFARNNKHSLLPGSTGIVYLEYEVIIEKELNLKHQLSYSLEGRSYTSLGAKIKIPNEETIVIGPPLEGGPWIAIYSPLWPRGHRRVFYTVDGKARIPGRFAIDFMKLDKNGKTAEGNENLVSNWYGYNADVLAVSDGEIASVRTDFKDSEKLDSHPKYKSSEATGNYISLKIGNGKYVFYEHLKAESIRVKPGQKVKKGDVIASLGLTGQAFGPHLHFHVANKNSPLGAEGVPFAFEEFKLLGVYNDFEKFRNRKLWDDLNQETDFNIKNERPAPNTVIKFDD